MVPRGAVRPPFFIKYSGGGTSCVSEIDVPRRVILCRALLEDKAPIMCAELKKACPFEARLTYAKICDNEIVFQAPVSKYVVETPCIP